MRFAILALGAAILLSPAVMAQAEQQEINHHGMMHAMDQQQRISKTAKLRVTNDPRAQELTLRIGPVELPAHTDHLAIAQPPDFFLPISFDGSMISYHPRLIDAHGQLLPHEMLDHVGFWNMSRRDFLCPEKEEHVFGAGGEMNDWPEIPGFGYRVEKGDRFRISTMFVNPTGRSYPAAYLEVKIDYRLKVQANVSLQDVYPAWFDVTGCGGSAYNLEPGLTTKTGRFRLRYAGKLLGVGGHLHQYGEWLTLKDETSDESIAALRPAFDDAERVLSMPVKLFTQREGFPVSRGDVIEVTDAYDNPTGKVIPGGAMGIAVAYFLPDDANAFSALRRKLPAPSGP